jgi:hypothetical protein
LVKIKPLKRFQLLVSSSFSATAKAVAEWGKLFVEPQSSTAEPAKWQAVSKIPYSAQRISAPFIEGERIL